MKSMTGFGQAIGQTSSQPKKTKAKASENIELEVSLRTLNGRFFEMRMHSPKEFLAFETEIRKLVQKKIRRAHVDMHIYRRARGGNSIQKVTIREDRLLGWKQAYSELCKKVGAKWQPKLEDFLHQNDIFEVEELAPTHDEKKLLFDLVERALDQCDQVRAKEGISVQKELLELLQKLKKNLSVIEQHQGQAQVELKEKFDQKRLEIDLKDADRVSQELVFLLDRMDIREEVQRLGAHLKTLGDLVQKQTVDGKKLDFYAQELLREANTIGSKCHIRAVTDAVIESKTCIERIREQAQNLE